MRPAWASRKIDRMIEVWPRKGSTIRNVFFFSIMAATVIAGHGAACRATPNKRFMARNNRSEA
jgi:hypothetical protein